MVRRNLRRHVIKIIIDTELEHPQCHAMLARMFAPATPATKARTITAVTSGG